MRVATGGAAGDVDGVHRRLGAGVGVKRHWGRPKRRDSSAATSIEPSVGAAKWVPSSIRALTAAPTSGLAWPMHITPKPLWKST